MSSGVAIQNSQKYPLVAICQQNIRSQKKIPQNHNLIYFCSSWRSPIHCPFKARRNFCIRHVEITASLNIFMHWFFFYSVGYKKSFHRGLLKNLLFLNLWSIFFCLHLVEFLTGREPQLFINCGVQPAQITNIKSILVFWTAISFFW